MNDGDKKILSDTLTRISKGLRVTKVVCTRSVKGRSGDHYVGFSAGWDTVQDDAGGGADLNSAQDGDVAQATHDSGMTLRDAKLAGYVLGMQADIAAHDAALAGSSISEQQHTGAVRSIKSNYMQHIQKALKLDGGE